MKTYTTSKVAKIIGVHPNTVRLYEKWELIPKVQRTTTGYRIYTDFHIEVFKLARIAFQIELTQSGLRKTITEVIKSLANEDFNDALVLLDQFYLILDTEIKNAREAISVVENTLQHIVTLENIRLKRSEAAKHVHISIDTLRNWERNGLLVPERLENGYCLYTQQNIERLKIIRTLRFANYSLESILRLINELDHHDQSQTSITQILNTPNPDASIISVCDCLLVSLNESYRSADMVKKGIEKLKQKK